MDDEAQAVHGQHEIGRQFDAHVYDEKYFEGGAETSNYDSYMNCRGIVEKQFEIIDEVMNKRVPAKTNLDLGCAYGFSCNKLRELGWTSIGVDISDFAISKARELFDTGFSTADAIKPWNFRAANDRIGLVTAIEFFEHIPSADAGRLIAQCALNADWGFFLVNGRTYPGEDEHKIDSDHGHLNFHNMSWWVTQCAKHGEIDWEAMFEFNLLADEVEDVDWTNRAVIVRFDHEA